MTQIKHDKAYPLFNFLKAGKSEFTPSERLSETPSHGQVLQGFLSLTRPGDVADEKQDSPELKKKARMLSYEYLISISDFCVYHEQNLFYLLCRVEPTTSKVHHVREPSVDFQNQSSIKKEVETPQSDGKKTELKLYYIPSKNYLLGEEKKRFLQRSLVSSIDHLRDVSIRATDPIPEAPVQPFTEDPPEDIPEISRKQSIFSKIFSKWKKSSPEIEDFDSKTIQAIKQTESDISDQDTKHSIFRHNLQELPDSIHLNLLPYNFGAKFNRRTGIEDVIFKFDPTRDYIREYILDSFRCMSPNPEEQKIPQLYKRKQKISAQKEISSRKKVSSKIDLFHNLNMIRSIMIEYCLVILEYNRKIVKEYETFKSKHLTDGKPVSPRRRSMERAPSEEHDRLFF